MSNLARVRVYGVGFFYRIEILQKEKVEREKEKAALDSLFKPVQTQKVSAGADPKSVLCLFFKQGLCTKGDKCKFSHDLSLEGKAEKRSMYVDAREQEDLEQGIQRYMHQLWSCYSLCQPCRVNIAGMLFCRHNGQMG